MIIVVLHEASYTGAPTSALDLCDALRKEYGYDFLFVFQDGGPLLQEFKKRGEVLLHRKEYSRGVIPFRVRLWWHQKKFTKSLTRALRKRENHLIYTNTMAIDIALVVVMCRLHIPMLTHVREGRTVLEWLKQKGGVSILLKQTDRFIAISKSIQQMLVQDYGIDNERVSLIPNGLEMAQFEDSTKARKKRDKNNNVILGCGTILYRKGVDLFIKTAYHLIKVMGRSKVKFIWVGGNLDSLLAIELIDEAKKYGVESFIEFVGNTVDVKSYYKKSDIFFLSSREEPFGKVMIEAARFYLPVIAFKQSGFPDEYVDDQVGYLADYGNIVMAADAIAELIDNEEHYQSCAINNFQRSESYSLSQTAESVHKEIEAILGH